MVYGQKPPEGTRTVMVRITEEPREIRFAAVKVIEGCKRCGNTHWPLWNGRPLPLRAGYCANCRAILGLKVDGTPKKKGMPVRRTISNNGKN